VGSLSLQPAALHLPFKVTWAYELLHKPDLLLDPRMDNWGRGTFTLSVSRLYRRAVAVANQGRFPLKSWFHLGLEPPVEHIVQVDIAQQRREH
jgi:hypothetical protein